MTEAALSRRQFMSGITAKSTPDAGSVVLPPYVSAQSIDLCTGCGDCVAACPEQVLVIDESTARVAFDIAETGCTICGKCAQVCESGAMDITLTPVIAAHALIQSGCLLDLGVDCRLCTDFCDAEALRFDLSIRPVGGLSLDLDSCTGCGACVGACPQDAIALKPLPIPEPIKANA